MQLPGRRVPPAAGTFVRLSAPLHQAPPTELRLRAAGHRFWAGVVMRIIRLSTTSECGLHGTGDMREHAPFPVQHMNAPERLGGACWRLRVLHQRWFSAGNHTKVDQVPTLLTWCVQVSREASHSLFLCCRNKVCPVGEGVDDWLGRQRATAALLWKAGVMR